MTVTMADALAHGHGVERPFCCPMHGDSHPSASLNILKMVWFCYTCHAHGQVGGEDLLVETDYDALRGYIAKETAEATELPESWLNSYESDHEYWRTRGFSEETISYYRLGHDYEHDCAVYPLRNISGGVLGVVRRQLAGAKYKHPYGVDISTLLFDYHRLESDYLVICEGATDVMAAHEVGVEATAVYGSRLSSAQAALVRRYDPVGVLVASDMDDAGWSLYRMTCALLGEYPVSRVFWPRREGKDLASLPVKKRKEILLNGLEPFIT